MYFLLTSDAEFCLYGRVNQIAPHTTSFNRSEELIYTAEIFSFLVSNVNNQAKSLCKSYISLSRSGPAASQLVGKRFVRILVKYCIFRAKDRQKQTNSELILTIT